MGVRGNHRGIPGAVGKGSPVGFPRRTAGLAGRALLVPDLASPGFYDGGVRSGTLLTALFARLGWPAGHPRAARVHSGRAPGLLGVRAV